MSFFHGSELCDLEVGQYLIPVRESKVHGNPRTVENLTEVYDDGVERDDYDVVWLTTDVDEAEAWGHHPLLKTTHHEVKAMEEERGKPVALIVYEVEPVGPVFRRLTPHSDTEYGCNKALIIGRTVIEEFDWRDFYYERGDNGTWIDPDTGEVADV